MPIDSCTKTALFPISGKANLVECDRLVVQQAQGGFHKSEVDQRKYRRT